MILLVLALALAAATAPEKLTNGVEFRRPADWVVQHGPQAAVMLPPGAPQNLEQAEEVYIVSVLAGVTNPDDPKLIEMLKGQVAGEGHQSRSAGAPKPFAAAFGKGQVHSWDITTPTGEQAELKLFLVGLKGGGVASLIAMGKRPRVSAREAELVAVAASIQNPGGTSQAPDESSPLAVRWRTRLSGKLLFQGSGNSQAGAGGFNSSRRLALAADGRFEYLATSSVYITGGTADGNSSSREQDSGRWRVYTQGGQPILELKNAQGDVQALPLEDGRDGVYVNGARYVIGPLR